MSPFFVRSLVVLVTLLLSSPLVPASADPVVVDDPTDDAWSYAASADPEPAPAPETVTNVDLVSATTSHGRRMVAVEVRYVDLDSAQQVQVFPAWRIRTGGKHEFRATMNLSSTGDGFVGEASLERNGKNLSTKDYCRLRPFADEDAGVIGVRIGRACLGKPRWVDVAAVSQMCVFCEDLFYDFVGNPGGEEWTWSGKVRRS